MTRVERMVAIRDSVLQLPDDAWVAAGCGEFNYLLARGQGWYATLTPTDYDVTSKNEMSEILFELRDAFRAKMMPFRLEIWVKGKGDVLTLYSDHNEISKARMRRGVWESEIFLMPICPGRNAPTLH